MLRLAQITLPLADNDYNDLARVHAELANQLIQVWGGFTSHIARGAWADNGRVYEEHVRVYSVAMEPDALSRVLLDTLAYDIGRKAKQLAIAVTYADGEFSILDIEQEGE